MSIEVDSGLNSVHVEPRPGKPVSKPRISLGGHPVVRSQGSRVALLRQPPPSASSITSGQDVEHFPLPETRCRGRFVDCRASHWILSAVFVVTTAISLLLLHAYGWISIGGAATEKICLKPACIKSAARVLSRLDPTVDPCKDFYKFACGKFLASGSIPDDINHLSTLQEMQDDMFLSLKRIIEESRPDEGSDSIRKAKQLYASCMSQEFEDSIPDGTTELPVLALLWEELGAWPLVQPQLWREEDASLEQLVAILAAYQVHTFFDLYISPDEKNSSVLSIQMYKGEPLVDKEWFEPNRTESSGSKYQRYLRSYRNLLHETVLLLSGGKHELLEEAEEILKFEAKFAKVSASSCSDHDSYSSRIRIKSVFLDSPGNRSYGDDQDSSEHRYTLADLENQYPALNWTRIIDWLLLSVGVTEGQRSRIVNSDLGFNLQCQTFLAETMELLQSTPKRTITNYLVWRFIYKMMPYISGRLHRLAAYFRSTVASMGEERIYMTRWKHCVNLVNEGMGLTLAHLYIDREAPHWTNTRVLQLIEELKEVFGRTIEQQEWIEDHMKQQLLQKLKLMGSKIGFPNRIYDTEELDREYEGLLINDEHILYNVARMRKHEVWREVKKIFYAENPKEKDWLVQPLVVNAFHNPGTNEIIFPLGILREPLYHPDYPKYILYGNLGVVIGHELIHGFDENGRRYDHSGNSSQWWSDALLKEFRKRADCFVRQYSLYPIETTDKNVDGNVTLGDNICDNAGMAHAWSAYQKSTNEETEYSLPGVSYSHEQLFFITYGQIWCEVLNSEGFEKYAKEVHSPGRYRAIGVLQNSPVFSEVFSCPLGSPMNPEKKCRLWS